MISRKFIAHIYRVEKPAEKQIRRHGVFIKSLKLTY